MRLEFEGHEHTNRVRINGQTIGYLPSQTWADMWTSATLPVPADLLRTGYNELIIQVGRSLPGCQVPGNAWDELLFRHVRLERVEPMPVVPIGGKPVTITVVFDNNTNLPGLQTAWGFGCVVQHGEHTLLFDIGADGRMLLANMAALGFAPRDLDTIVLSHAHTDHTGGLEAVLQHNPNVKVYLPEAFPDNFKKRVQAHGAQVIAVTGPIEIVPGVWSTGQMGAAIVEQALVVRTNSGLTVITGCAHPGIVAMVRRAQEVGQTEIALVLGGFHLSAESSATLQSIAADLHALGVKRIAPCHCTGDRAKTLLATAFGDRYYGCGAGLVLPEGELRDIIISRDEE